ncbi:MAG: EAL domain-containing protein, partial [Micromonosporaceae bacterium]|nr:EAL domain-containing protein [Micromonosporaceae bacterium]
VGFAEGRVPTAVLVEAIVNHRPLIRVPGAGLCHLATAPLNRHDQGYFIVARSGAEGFSADEFGLLRGMARALELTLETIRTMAAQRELLASLQQRQLLLEQISDIQRAITRRAPHQEVLDSITLGASRLLPDDVIALWMRDPDDPGSLLLVSSRGLSEETVRRLWRIPLASSGTLGEALSRNRIVVASPAFLVGEAGGGEAGRAEAGRAEDSATEAGEIVSVMAAPVHEGGVAVGCLEVASRRADRVFLDADCDILRVFSEQVSLAVTDARTHEAMREAFHDPLTGLASRRLFTDQLEHAIAAAARDGTRVAVLFVDLDSFKIVNDSLGHSAGDQLLIGVAKRLSSCIREGDVAARLGGDEFAVVLVDLADEKPAVLVAERIIEAVRRPFVIDGKEAFVDVSVGISLDGWGSTGGDSLLCNADLAMYQAKRKGKGRYEVFRPALREAFARRLDLEADLRHAIERDELVLHYQPIYDLKLEEVTGVEALLRWQHPQRGLLPPAEFIPLAEESGLIIPLEAWALATACSQASRWNQARAAPLTLNVNLSVRQVQRPDLAELVARTPLTSGLPPDQLVLEITESLFLQGTDAIRDRLRQLEDLRVRLAVDDFGTGYSSLSYLSLLPIHIIKIDKSFVDNMMNGPLALAIIQLVRTLGLVTLAEGIESVDQLEALRDAGCQFGQGFLFSKPLAPAEVEPLLTPRETPLATGISPCWPAASALP